MDEEERSEDNYITSFSDRSTRSYCSDCYSHCCEWEEFPSPSWRSTSTGSLSDIHSRSNSKAQKWPLDILAKEFQELSTTREEVLTKFDLEMSKGMLNKYQIHQVRSWLLQIDQTTALVNTFDSSSLQKKEILSMFPWRKNKGVRKLRKSIMDLKGHGEKLLRGFDVTPRFEPLFELELQKIVNLLFEPRP